ncbi:hypothetical protein CPB84DRAFT_1678322 [Gymnopilus junonius]|uniref:Complex 1 LYR protein domain-containing protein n=1 Tax=Gymnopilus junonius TaxID=109634 RepID=A0A9P5NQN9_GYMJU|nr:hypothetical protein CPB84DRAFT_1678322 [Gymnopilus junonius]
MVARSGLQKEVLQLYRRRALRMAKNKPEAVRPKFNLFVRYTFRTNASKVSPRNISYIEHLLRQGKKQVEQYEDPAVKDCFVSKEMTEWAFQRHILKEYWFKM